MMPKSTTGISISTDRYLILVHLVLQEIVALTWNFDFLKTVYLFRIWLEIALSVLPSLDKVAI